MRKYFLGLGSQIWGVGANDGVFKADFVDYEADKLVKILGKAYLKVILVYLI